MDEILRLKPSRAALAQLYSGTWEHEHPSRILAGISPEKSCQRLHGLPYNIAELLAHINFWQDRRLELTKGQTNLPEDFQFGVTDFPAVGPEDWEALVAHFHRTLRELLETSTDNAAMEAVVFDDRDIGIVITSHALHNSYHFGEIVLMRRMLGIWPPPKDTKVEEY